MTALFPHYKGKIYTAFRRHGIELIKFTSNFLAYSAKKYWLGDEPIILAKTSAAIVFAHYELWLLFFSVPLLLMEW